MCALSRTGGVQTVLHAGARPREPAQTGELHPRQLHVILHTAHHFGRIRPRVGYCLHQVLYPSLEEPIRRRRELLPRLSRCHGSSSLQPTSLSCCYSMDQVKGVLALQGEALTQAVSRTRCPQSFTDVTCHCKKRATCPNRT